MSTRLKHDYIEIYEAKVLRKKSKEFKSKIWQYTVPFLLVTFTFSAKAVLG